MLAPGWGLLELATHQPLMPPAFIIDEKIEMSGSELQNFAVQIVRDTLEKAGRTLMPWQDDPEVDPSPTPHRK